MTRFRHHVPEARDPRDERTINRLRSALDELTDGLPTEAHGPSDPPRMVISLEDRRRERRWAVPVLAGVAAAAVMAVATVAIMRDPVAAPSPAPATDGPDVPTSLPTPPSSTEAPDMGLASLLPVYTLDLPVESAEALDLYPTDLAGGAWVQPETGAILTMQVRPAGARGEGPLGTSAVPDESFPAVLGRAWTLGGETLADGIEPSWLWWERPDGDVWMLTMIWSTYPPTGQPQNPHLALREWALSIEPGSGLPYVLPDDSWNLLAMATPGQRSAISRTWVVDGHEVLLFTIEGSVVTGLTNLAHHAMGTGQRPEPLAVATTVGFGIPDGEGGYSQVGWATTVSNNVMNTLTIPPELSHRSAEIIAAVRLVPADVDPVDNTPPTRFLWTSPVPFTIDLPDAVGAEDIFRFPQPDDDSRYWVHADGADRGILRVSETDRTSDGPEGDYNLEEITGEWIGEGRAWLLRPNEPRYGPNQLFWDRGTGVVNLYTYGLTADQLVAAAVAVGQHADLEPERIVFDGGSNGPEAEGELLLVRDDRWSEGGIGSYASQAWAVGDGTATLEVHLPGPDPALQLATGALVVSPVTVAGQAGHTAYLANGQTVTWWPADDEAIFWAILITHPDLAARSDEIIAAIRP